MNTPEKCPHCGAIRDITSDLWSCHHTSVKMQCGTVLRQDGTVIYRGVRCYKREIANLTAERNELKVRVSELEQLESGQPSQSVCDGLREAAEAFADDDEPRHPWYTWPGRAVLMIGSLAASVWRDWFPPKTCEGCRHWGNEPQAFDHCSYTNQPVPDEFVCKHSEKRK